MYGPALEQFEKLLSKCNGRVGYLNPNAVNQWLQSVFRKAFPTLPKKVEMGDSTSRKIKSFEWEQNGPA